MFHHMRHPGACFGGGGRHRGPFGPEWGHDFSRRGGSGGPGGSRSHRIMDGTELRLVLLRLIGEEPRHGYDLIRAIEGLSGGAYAPSPGTVYPALTMLTEMELIAEQDSADSRRRYALTDRGAARVAEEQEAIEALIGRLRAIGAERARTESGPVRRAMSNLGAVVRDRVLGGGDDAETLHEIAALLDEAARKIERLA